MPKHIEEKLEKQAKKKGLKTGSKRFNAYVYGTLAEIEKKIQEHKGKKKK